MARPLRIEYPGVLYHVTSRGNRQEDIYLNDGDRNSFLQILARVCDRFNWVYTQSFNRNHGRVGHVFQGRYKAIMVQKDSYLLELSRYIVLNPVRAGMVRSAKDWQWSSYQSTAGLVTVPAWLKVDWLWSCFGKRKKLAIERYRQFVSEGKHQTPPWSQLKSQIYLGDDAFVEEMLAKLEPDTDLSEIPSSQKRKLAQPLHDYFDQSSTRNEGIYRAYQSGGYSMKAIADAIGLHYSTVSKVIKSLGKSRFKT